VGRAGGTFEFNGTPEMARTIILRNTGRLGGCYDTFDASGNVVKHCLDKAEVPPAGSRMVVHTGAPAGATSALVNIKTLSVGAAGQVFAEACDLADPASRLVPSAYATVGRTTVTPAIVPLDDTGAFCLYQNARMHLTVDVDGYFTPLATTAGAAQYYPMEQARLSNTLFNGYCSPDVGCVGPGRVPTGRRVTYSVATSLQPVAIVADVITAQTPAAGFLAADVCSNLGGNLAMYANVNFDDASVISSLAVIRATSDATAAKFCTYASTARHELIDTHGMFAAPSADGLGFTDSDDTRLADTRECWTDSATATEQCGIRRVGGEIMHLTAPEGAKVVAVELTTISPSTAGWVSAGTCPSMETQPVAWSNAVYRAGTTGSGLAFVPVGDDGTFCVSTSADSHVVVDLVGVFSADSESGYVPRSPVRVLDTRRIN